MDTISLSALQQLAGEQPTPCVSLYMTTHPAGAEGQQDPVRWRHLLAEAEQQLQDTGLRSADARRLIESARDLPADAAFWRERSHGLAVFVSADRCLAFRLPRQFDDLSVVNRRFYIKPLLPVIADSQLFFILTLSQNQVRLFRANGFGMEQVSAEGLPASLKETLNISSVDRGSQVHSASRGDTGKQGAVFHGQGGQPDTRKEEIRQFFRVVDAAVQRRLSDEAAPLLLAGVEYLLPIYREVSRCAQLADAQLEGNFDHVKPSQLLERARGRMEPVFQEQRDCAARRLEKLAGTDKTSHDIRQVLPAASQGRVDVLFFDRQQPLWGRYRADDGMVELHEDRQPGDEDLLDLAAVQTLKCRGTVHAVPRESVPGGGSVAALFRF